MTARPSKKGPASEGPSRGITVAELARRLGGALELARPEHEARVLRGVRGIEDAGPEHLSFISNRRYVRLLSQTRAGAVLLDRRTPRKGRSVIRVDDPYAAFARALALFHPPVAAQPGVHASAVVDPTAQVAGAEIRALAYVGPRAVVGAGSVVGVGAYVGADASLGRECRLLANAVLCESCQIGDRVVLNPGSVVGGEGFGFAPTPQGHVKIPQVGRARLEDDVELGSNSCVDRAAMGETLVRGGAKLDNLVQVGHAAEVGEHALMVAYSGVAGSTRLGRFVTLAAKVAVLGHLSIGDRVQVGAGSVVSADLPAGAHVSGRPAFEHRRWRRAALALRDLPDLLRKLRQLEARVAELERERVKAGSE